MLQVIPESVLRLRYPVDSSLLVLAGWYELVPLVSYLFLVRLSPACSPYLSCRGIYPFR